MVLGLAAAPTFLPWTAGPEPGIGAIQPMIKRVTVRSDKYPDHAAKSERLLNWLIENDPEVRAMWHESLVEAGRRAAAELAWGRPQKPSRPV